MRRSIVLIAFASAILVTGVSTFSPAWAEEQAQSPRASTAKEAQERRRVLAVLVAEGLPAAARANGGEFVSEFDLTRGSRNRPRRIEDMIGVDSVVVRGTVLYGECAALRGRAKDRHVQ